MHRFQKCIAFRLWLAVAIPLAGLLPPASAQEAGQPVPLFNGKDLSGWADPLENSSSWEVKDGVLEGRGGGGANWASLVANDAQHANFKLKIQYRFPESGGGGIELRREGEANVTSCYWVSTSVLPYRAAKGRSPGNLMKLKDYRYNSNTAPPVRKSAQIDARFGRWHTLEITAIGNRITTFLNGQKSDEFIDAKGSYRSGSIALTCFGDSVVQFREVLIQPLPE